MRHWRLHKFGGTSLASAERYRAAARLAMESAEGPTAVVVSAMVGMTDALVDLLEFARRGEEVDPHLEAVRLRQVSLAEELLGSESKPVISRIEKDVRDLHDLLRAVTLCRSYSSTAADLATSYGELWSAQVFSGLLTSLGHDSRWLDARQVLFIEASEVGPTVLWKESSAAFGRFLEDNATGPLVITGFIASTVDGLPATLGRNGSDLSAAIFGALLSADAVTIWTDVDGVLSADPARVPEAVVLRELSYDEAMELAYFGAKVLHPGTMTPAIAHKIPLFIRNALHPERPGTSIGPRAPDQAGATPASGPVKGLSTVDGVSLINVEGAGMVGVPGVAERLFGALRQVGVSVVMISQASSEHSICFAVPHEHAGLAKKTVEKAFSYELDSGKLQRVDRADDCSILAAVGDGMADSPGVAAKFFGALSKARVNVRAIAQGSSERNISAVVAKADAHRALRAVHSSFYLSDRTLSVGIVGPGLVGHTLLGQLAARQEALRAEFKIDFRVRAIARSGAMLLEEDSIDLTDWKNRLSESAQALDLQRFADHIQPPHLPHAVIVDCTASEVIAQCYEPWLARGIHVVTPNKKAGSGNLDSYRRLRALGNGLRTHFLYEATVGAGLPIITTLRDLVQTGDQITAIEGIFSGTLSYVFNVFEGASSFSEVVRDAKTRGYTEPDPRDDLSGMDVARKLIILAREIGLDYELSDVSVENLVPEGLRKTETIAEFMERIVELDAEMASRKATAEKRHQRLRYVGSVGREQSPTVELRAFAPDHPFGRIQGTDNIFAFYTKRYAETPLIVQGPGAGPEVTAGGVFADLLRLAAQLGGTR